MGAWSKIEWTDSTFNPWVGCTKIARAKSAPSACDFCYAEKWAKRSGQVGWGNFPRRRTTSVYWRNPIIWNEQARSFQSRHGRRQRVFCASLADVFDNQVDPTWRSDLFNLIRDCDQLDWQILTKRPQNIKKMLPHDWKDGYPNVWIGTTAEDAGAYKQRVPHLLKVPAAVHFVSYEPAIGPLEKLDANGLSPDWLIIGGESGVRSDLIRRTEPQWVRAAIAECRRLGIAAFLKQWGTYQNNPRVVEEFESVQEAMRFDPPENGKGGAKLDDQLWRDFPTAREVLTPPVSGRERAIKNGTERRTVFA
ncbi:MAG: phage Gp37/Gp68 family protein [Xanthobacteraceae bacterium]|nr:phage Gp37/Gp68 family protein [Xanthobacteraceae bacterium]